MRRFARAVSLTAILLVLSADPAFAGERPVRTAEVVETPVVRRTVTMHRCDSAPGETLTRDAATACASGVGAVTTGTCIEEYQLVYNRNEISFLGIRVGRYFTDAFLRIALHCNIPVFDCLTFGEVLIGAPAAMFGAGSSYGTGCGTYQTTPSLIGPLPNTVAWVNCATYDSVYCGAPDALGFT